MTTLNVIPLAVPLSHRMALSISTRTNPASSGIVCSFTLPTTDAARLEVFDMAGRRMCEQKIDGASAGPNVASLAIEGRPGVYLIRLTQAGLAAATRVVVIR